MADIVLFVSASDVKVDVPAGVKVSQGKNNLSPAPIELAIVPPGQRTPITISELNTRIGG